MIGYANGGTRPGQAMWTYDLATFGTHTVVISVNDGDLVIDGIAVW